MKKIVALFLILLFNVFLCSCDTLDIIKGNDLYIVNSDASVHLEELNKNETDSVDKEESDIIATSSEEKVKTDVESNTTSLFDTSEKTHKATVSGSYIILNDVSSTKHNLKVSLSSDSITNFSSVRVSRYGSNLIDISKLLKNNCVDNGDGTYTLTRTGLDRDNCYSNYQDIFIPKGTPVYMRVNVIENKLSQGVLYATYVFSDGTTELLTISDKDKNGNPNRNVKIHTFDKAIVKIGIMCTTTKNVVGDYITFTNPKLNIGQERVYQDYIAPQTVVANADGTVSGLTSISPTVTLIANGDVKITCEYQKERVNGTVSDLTGKIVVNFGDSIFGNARPPKDVSTFLAAATNATIHNAAFGGCRMGKHTGNWNDFSMYRLADAIATGDWTLQDDALNYSDRTSYAETPLALLKSLDFSKIDAITIAYGTNDFTGGNVIDDANNKYNTDTFAGALRYSIEKIKSAYPNIDIILCTPTYRFWMDSNGNFLYDSNEYEKNGYKLTDFVQKTKDVANEYGLTVIDNYYGCGIDKSNRNEYFPSNDGTHPNETGRQMIADYMGKELIKFYNN